MGRAKNKPQTDDLFLPYQRRWIEDDSVLKLIEKSRQVGLTWGTAYRIVRLHALASYKRDSWISSRDEMQAMLFIADCKKFASLLQIAAEDMGLTIVDPAAKTSAYTLRFANGTCIYSLSSNADAQAGKRGNRLFDEFALHPDPKRLYDIGSPGITWGGSLEIISTHRGAQNYFNKLILEVREGGNPKNISLHRVTLQDALDEGFLHKLQSKLPEGDFRQEMDEADYFNYVRSTCSTEEQFMEEFMCQPADDSSAFISYELLMACSRHEYKKNVIHLNKDNNWHALDLTEEVGKYRLDFTGEYYLGMDIARKRDLSAIWLAQKVGSLMLPKLVISLEACRFARQEEVLYSLLEVVQLKRACIDATGIGAQLAERARERFGSKVEDVMFSNSWKEDAATKLHMQMEDRSFLVPLDDHVFADFRSIRKVTTSAGHHRYEGERKNADSHADRFWAAALCNHAQQRPNTWTFAPIAC